MITIKHRKTGRVEVLTKEQYNTLTDVIGTSAAFTVIQNRGLENTEAEAETGAGNIDAGAGKRRGRKRKH